MNTQQISTPAAIGIIIAVVAIAGGLLYFVVFRERPVVNRQIQAPPAAMDAMSGGANRPASSGAGPGPSFQNVSPITSGSGGSPP